MRRTFSVILFLVMASIDNTVLAILPQVVPSVGAEFGVPDRLATLIVSLNLLVVALTGLVWGYRSDQRDRRRLLLIGTLAWALPVALVRWADSYPTFLALMLLAGLGLGCISTVGYSIITDLVPERRRGLLLGIWGLAQGIGSLLAGLLVGRLLEQQGWRAPLEVMALAGLGCSALALLAVSPAPGSADEALRALHARGGEYPYRIRRADLPLVLGKASNRWLMAQGFLAQLAYGPLYLLVVLLTARLTAQGLPLERANSLAALFWTMLQLGGIISLLWGWLGDRLQQRNPRARALIAAYGFWLALPCYLALFWTPLPLEAPAGGSALALLLAQLRSSAWWWIAVLAATLAVAAQATNAPNWFALVSDVNLPEHRGTAFSLVTLANNLARALGTLLAGVTFDLLRRGLPEPINYALGLSLFQLFFVPAGLCFWLAARHAPHDIAAVRATLHLRAAQPGA